MNGTMIPLELAKMCTNTPYFLLWTDGSFKGSSEPCVVVTYNMYDKSVLLKRGNREPQWYNLKKLLKKAQFFTVSTEIVKKESNPEDAQCQI